MRRIAFVERLASARESEKLSIRCVSVDPLASRVAERYLGVDPLAYSVARRFMADAIANPQDLLQKYDDAVRHVADLEPTLPKMREAQKVIDQNGGFDVAKGKAYRNELAPHENELLNDVYFKHLAIYRFAAKVNLDVFKRVNAWSLFLAILQQYELAPATRKTIEAAAKFFAKARVQRPKPAVALDAYENFLKVLRSYSMAAHDAIAHGKPRAGGAAGQELVPEKVRAGPFTLINTGGFSDAVIAECAKVVEVAAHQLQSHGLGMVCYGDVLISNTLMGSNILAFYMISKDEMFVRANLKGKEGAAVHTVVHELGHRLQWKFVPPGKQKEIEHIYRTIARNHSEARSEAIDRVWKDPSLKPKVGDSLVSKGEEYKVSGFDVSPKGEIIVQLKREVPDAPGLVQHAKVGLESYAAMKGILPKINHSGFVTGYARKDAGENFAEMIAFYCAGKLPEDQVEMLKGVLA